MRMAGVTWRRSAARMVLRGAAAVPVRRGTPIALLPALQDAESILARARQEAPGWCAATAYWPVQPDRGRAYIHLLDDQGGPVAFLKLANGEDASGLDRELTALDTLRGGTCRFSTPRLWADGFDGKTRWLLMEPLPRIDRQRHVQAMAAPTQVIADIRGEVRHVTPSDLGSLSWWSDLQRQLHRLPSAFVQDLEDAVTSGLDVSRSHGDFGGHNIVTTNGRTWIFDWEAFAQDAPAQQDLVNFHIVRGDSLDEFIGRTGLFPHFVACCAFGIARRSNGFESLVMNWMSWKKM